MATAKKADTVKVTVSGNWQVVHEDKTWEQGQTATVPLEVAEAWENAGLVTR